MLSNTCPVAVHPAPSRPCHVLHFHGPTQARRMTFVYAQQQGGAAGDALGRIARSIQGALPVVGLLSRLTAPAGFDEDLAYPEYCRATFENGSREFQIAVAELQQRHGNPAQRKYMLLILWMTGKCVGLLEPKIVVDAARRLRVSQDIEFEMERFSSAFSEAAQKYTFVERPRGRPQDRAELAVDALCRLCLGLRDGEVVPEGDAVLIEDAVLGGLWTEGEGFRDVVRKAIETRESRSQAYV